MLLSGCVDAEKDCDAGAGSLPVEQAFRGRGISQSLSSQERVIDLGEPGTVGGNFCHGGDFYAFDTNHLHWGGFHGNLFTVDEIKIFI